MPLQLSLLYLIPRITGSLSLIGSSFIMYDLLKCVKQKLDKKSIVNRILLCLSISDAFALVSCWILGVLPVPKELNEVYNRNTFYGNTTTCTIQEFVYQWSVFTTSTILLAICQSPRDTMLPMNE